MSTEAGLCVGTLKEGFGAGFQPRRELVQACAAADASNTTAKGSHQDAHHRGLLQNSPGPVEVSTARGLVQAVATGAQDIIITEHIDLTALPLPLK